MGIVDYEEKYKHPLIPADQGSRDILSPYEAENIDYIYEQILYRNSVLLEANGETFQIWRKPRSGSICDNPACPISSDINQAPKPNCPRCSGTGYIGGYQYKGETLIRVAPTGMMFSITEQGMMKVHNPKTWTFPEPEILTFDILIAVDRPRLIQESRLVDYELNRRVDINANYDEISEYKNIIRIMKISDLPNSSEDYKKNIDYKLSNNGILWLNNKRPDDLMEYYVTFLTTEEYIRRFETGEVTRSVWRGKILHQELVINELDITHPVYKHITIKEYDMARYYYPFPVSDWFLRE